MLSSQVLHTLPGQPEPYTSNPHSSFGAFKPDRPRILRILLGSALSLHWLKHYRSEMNVDQPVAEAIRSTLGTVI